MLSVPDSFIHFQIQISDPDSTAFNHKMYFPLLTSLFILPTIISAQTVYLIRHGEKPSDGGDGLSALGVERAQCLRSVFGAASAYDIGYIMAETPKSSMWKISFR